MKHILARGRVRHFVRSAWYKIQLEWPSVRTYCRYGPANNSGTIRSGNRHYILRTQPRCWSIPSVPSDFTGTGIWRAAGTTQPARITDPSLYWYLVSQNGHTERPGHLPRVAKDLVIGVSPVNFPYAAQKKCQVYGTRSVQQHIPAYSCVRVTITMLRGCRQLLLVVLSRFYIASKFGDVPTPGSLAFVDYS